MSFCILLMKSILTDFSSFTASIASGAPYYGKLIGNFITAAHEVMGTVRAADSKTIVIENFHYDGLGPGKALQDIQGMWSLQLL